LAAPPQLKSENVKRAGSAGFLALPGLVTRAMTKRAGEETCVPALAVMRRRDTERRGEFLFTLQVNVIDAHFAGLNSLNYLLKVWVFDLQSITDQ
jgi:hypothetical protein